MFSALVALSAVALIVLGTINRGMFTVSTVAGRTCKPATDLLASQNGAWAEIEFNNKDLCQAAGIELQAGRTYEISITLPQGWKDKSIPSDLTGISTSAAPWVYIPALPFRRVLRAPWFVPVARIGVWTPEYHMLTQEVTEVTPRQTGQLFLFVNDAVGPPGLRSFFYENNEPGPKDPAKVIVKEKVLTAAARFSGCFRNQLMRSSGVSGQLPSWWTRNRSRVMERELAEEALVPFFVHRKEPCDHRRRG